MKLPIFNLDYIKKALKAKDRIDISIQDIFLKASKDAIITIANTLDYLIKLLGIRSIL